MAENTDPHFNAMVCDGRNTDSKIMEKCAIIHCQ